MHLSHFQAVLARQKEKQFNSIAQQRRLIAEKLGSDISSSEDELLTGGASGVRTGSRRRKVRGRSPSPRMARMPKINFDDDASKDNTMDSTATGMEDRNLDDDQVCWISTIYCKKLYTGSNKTYSTDFI